MLGSLFNFQQIGYDILVLIPTIKKLHAESTIHHLQIRSSNDPIPDDADHRNQMMPIERTMEHNIGLIAALAVGSFTIVLFGCGIFNYHRIATVRRIHQQTKFTRFKMIKISLIIGTFVTSGALFFVRRVKEVFQDFRISISAYDGKKRTPTTEHSPTPPEAPYPIDVEILKTGSKSKPKRIIKKKPIRLSSTATASSAL